MPPERVVGLNLQSMRGPWRTVGAATRGRLGRTDRFPAARGGASKNVKKKAQKSVKEKRAEKKAKKGTVTRGVGE
jgi:hypothetical protein